MANQTIKRPSTTIGVDKYTFFKLEEDTAENLKYGTGYTLPGAVQITLTDDGGNDTFSADNGDYEIDTWIEKPGHEIETADIPPEVDAMWRGLEVDSAGGIKVKSIVNPPYFGVAWRTLHHGGSYRYFRSYKGMYSFASAAGGKTKPQSGAPEHQTAKASFTSVRTEHDDSLYYYIDDDDFSPSLKAEIAQKWFEDMNYIPNITSLGD